MNHRRHNLLRAAAGLVIVVLGAWLAWMGLASGRGALANLLRNPMFSRMAMILLAGVVVLAGIAIFWTRRGAVTRRVRPRFTVDADGTAMLEFAMLFPVAMAVVLVMVQAMYMMTALYTVNYAAYSAARTAIVWIPKDLSGGVSDSYLPEAVNHVTHPAHSLKMYNVNKAAAFCCISISGQSASVTDDAVAVRDGIQSYFSGMGGSTPSWVGHEGAGGDSSLVRQVAYAQRYTRAGLHDYRRFGGARLDLSGWDNLCDRDFSTRGGDDVFSERQDVTAWVYHDYAMTIPFAKLLFADRREGDYCFSQMVATATLSNEGVDDTIQEDEFMKSPTP